MLINNGKEFLKLSFQALSLQQSEYQPILSDSQYVSLTSNQSVSQAVSQSVRQRASSWSVSQPVSQMFNMLFCHVSNAS